MKKILLIMSIIITAFIINTAIANGEDGLLSVSEINAGYGEDIVLGVNLSNNPGITALQFNIKYDNTVMEYSGYEVGALTNPWEVNESSSGTIKCVYGPAAVNTTNGKILDLKFKVSSTAPANRYEVKIENLKAADANENQLSFSSSDGSVTIPEIQATVTGFTGAYDGDPHGISVVVTTPASGAEVKYGTIDGTYNEDSSPTITNASDPDLTVFYQITASGYGVKTGSASVTITKANPEITTPPVGKSNLVYTGSELELLQTAATASGGTIKYAVTADTVTTSPADGWDAALPKATDAGTHRVWYKVEGDGNYNDAVADTYYVDVTIAGKPIGYTAEGYSGTYDGSAHGITVSVTDPASGAEIKYGETEGSYTTTNPTYTNVNDTPKTVYYQITAENYETVTGSATVTISKATPTVTAPTGQTELVYSGSEQNLLATAGSTTGGTLKYAVTEDTVTTAPDTGWTTEAPKGTAAKTYRVWYMVEGGDNYNDVAADYLDVAIAGKDMAFTAADYGGTYDGSAHGISVEVTEPASGVIKYGETEGTYDKDSSPTIANVADSPKTVYFSITAENYKTVTGSKTITLTKAEPTVNTVPAVKTGLTHGENPLDLVTNGQVSGGEIQFALGTDGTTAPDSGWSAAIPQETDAGTYYVWWKVAGDANHNDKAAAYLGEPSISKAAAQTLTDVTEDEIFTAASVSASVAGKMPNDAGTLTYTAGTASKTGSVSVSNFTVDGNGNVSANISSGALNDTITLPVTITSTNYEDSSISVVITLVDKTAAGVSINADSPLTKTYGDAAFTLTASVTDAGTGTGTWTWTSDKTDVAEVTTDSATTTVTIKAASDEDVTIKVEYSSETTKGEATVTLKVNKATPEVDVKAANNLKYTGTAQGLITDFTTTGGTLYYAVTAVDVTTAPTEGWSTSLPTETKAIEYNVWYKVEGNGNYNGVDPQSVSASIGKAELKVTAKPKTITYGDDPANDGVSYDGFVNSESESVLGGTLAYTYDYQQYGNVGSGYKITPSGLSSDNYKIAFEEGALTVEQLEVSLDWTNTSLTFNDTVQAPTATATGTVNSDVISVTVTGGQKDAGGPYTATASGLTGNKAGNYKLPADNTTTFSIAKAAAPDTLKTASGSAKYGANGTVDLSSLIAAGGTVGEISKTDTDSVLEGDPTVSNGTLSYAFNNLAVLVEKTATVTVPVTNATNYNDYDITVTLTVLDKTPQTITASDVSVKYGETDKSVSAQADGGGTLSYAVTEGTDYAEVDPSTGAITTKKVGSATVTITAAENENYKEATKTITVTVEKADVSVTTAPAVKSDLVFNEQAQDLITAGVLSEGGTIYYALGTDGTTEPAADAWSTDVPKGTAIDTYYVWTRIDGDDNHNNVAPSFLGTVTISPKTMTVSAEGFTGVFDGEAHGITVTVTVPEEGSVVKYGKTEGSYDLESSPTLTDVGTLTVYYQASAENYEPVTGSATVTITEKGIIAKAEDLTVPYDGQPHGIKVEVTEPAEGYTIKYGKAEGSYTLDASPTITALSESPLKVYYQVTAPNYDAFTGSGMVTINPGKNLYSVDLSASPAEGGIAYADVSSALEDDLVTLTAVANGGYTFTGWTVTLGGISLSSVTETTATFIMGKENVAVTASFEKIYTTVVNEYEKGSNQQTADLTINFNDPDKNETAYQYVTSASVGGTVLTPGVDYTVEKGSVKIILQHNFLESLEVGSYTLQVTIQFPNEAPFEIPVYFYVTEPIEAEITNYQSNGSKGIPEGVEIEKITLTFQIKKENEVVAESTPTEFTISNGQMDKKETIQLKKKLREILSNEYTITVMDIKPKSVTVDTGIYDTKTKMNLTKTYKLSAEAWTSKGKIIIYLKWDDGTVPFVDEPMVHALPEDEIGAYALRADGTKEYLLFHTYDICMHYLGKDELCRGYERCFHKESPYVNPFVKP